MNLPDDSLSPLRPAFEETWHAQAMALAHTLVKQGAFTPTQWAEALGAALKRAEMGGRPDTEETYYLAVLEAVERLSDTNGLIAESEQTHRKKAWEKAYLKTPHGKPVLLHPQE